MVPLSAFPNEKRRVGVSRAAPRLGKEKTLLDLAFLVLDVLARDGVVLPHRHLLGHRPRVLLGHVEMARVGGRVEPDLDRRRFGHAPSPAIEGPRPPVMFEGRLLPARPPESTQRLASQVTPIDRCTVSRISGDRSSAP